jgi:hypothetical protein
MSKAKLVTRSETTSSVTDDNLGKAAALTHAEMDSNLINLRDASWGLADDSSTVLSVTNDKTVTIAGASGISTALSGDTLTITGPDLSSYITNSPITVVGDDSTGTVFNTGETIKIAGGTGITTAVSGDTLTITNSGTGTITALNNQAENRITTIGSTTTELDGEANLTFDGSTLTLTGQADIDYITIKDNTIATNASNANLELSANGTGYITLGEDFDVISTNTRYHYGTNRAYTGTHSGSTNQHINSDGFKVQLTGDLTGSGTVLQEVRQIFDLNGYDSTASSTKKARGNVGLRIQPFIRNDSATASTMTEASGFNNFASMSATQGDITITDYVVNSALPHLYANTGLTATATNTYGFYSSGGIDDGGSGTKTVGTMYHYYAGTSEITPSTEYAFYSNGDDLLNRAGKFERYREKINTLTSSSTITVDCALAPVHTVALGTNTQFVISNLGAGQSVTIIIKSSGSYTGTFGTDGSTAVKFPGGAPTLTASGTDVVTIFNDGTDYLGNIAQAYA